MRAWKLYFHVLVGAGTGFSESLQRTPIEGNSCQTATKWELSLNTMYLKLAKKRNKLLAFKRICHSAETFRAERGVPEAQIAPLNSVLFLFRFLPMQKWSRNVAWNLLVAFACHFVFRCLLPAARCPPPAAYCPIALKPALSWARAAAAQPELH